MLTLRRPLGLALLSLMFAGCSTALLVDTPYDDDPQPDAGVVSDSGSPWDAALSRDSSTGGSDGGGSRDAGTSSDAGGSRDAGSSRDAGGSADAGASRDAGGISDAGATRDAGVPPNPAFPRDCARELPSAGFASLLTDDCPTRPLLMCVSQMDLDAQFARLAMACRVPRNATIGAQIGPSGCPELLTYDQRSVQGQVSLCLQTVLESVRLNCPGRCALLRAP